jgi:hypothetical protein
MLLCELTGVKKYHELTYHEILSKLAKEAGVEWVGSGKYGIVLSNPTWNYVIKVFEDDPYYMGFVDYAITHPNRHYPKIIKKPLQMRSFYKRLRTNLNEKYFVCKIEKLYPLDPNLGNFVANNLDRLWSSYLWIYSTSNEARLEYEKKWGEDNSRDYSANTPFTVMMPNGESQNISHRDLFKKFPWLKTLVRAYINIMDNVAGSPDLHSGNFMQRKDGTIVIIDPVWAGKSPYQDYDRVMRDEYADYYDYYDEEPEMVSGPSYLKKNKAPPTHPQPSSTTSNNETDDNDYPF